MTPVPCPAGPDNPAIVRLNALSPLDLPSRQALERACADHRIVDPRFEFCRERQPMGRPFLMIEGWAASVRLLHGGQRQFIGFFLPGELIGSRREANPVASVSIVALTKVRFCRPPPFGTAACLDEAYALSEERERSHLYAQIVRLGRMSAKERIIDLCGELNDRLALAGIALDDGFNLPLTQETIADATGLTAVHVNRVLRQLRTRGDLEWRSGKVSFGPPVARALGPWSS